MNIAIYSEQRIYVKSNQIKINMFREKKRNTLFTSQAIIFLRFVFKNNLKKPLK